MATAVFGDRLKNRKIRFHCDNTAVVSVLNSMTSKSANVLALLRILTIQGLVHNCLIKAVHIPGCKNNIADALSRFQHMRFRRLAPSADAEVTPMPAYLWRILDVDVENWFSRGSREIHN